MSALPATACAPMHVYHQTLLIYLDTADSIVIGVGLCLTIKSLPQTELGNLKTKKIRGYSS